MVFSFPLFRLLSLSLKILPVNALLVIPVRLYDRPLNIVDHEGADIGISTFEFQVYILFSPNFLKLGANFTNASGLNPSMAINNTRFLPVLLDLDLDWVLDLDFDLDFDLDLAIDKDILGFPRRHNNI